MISPANETEVSVDDLEVAQLVYLLKYKKIRNVIETIGNKGVLVLGRFTERKEILDAIRDQVRQRGYLPMVFGFDRPTDRDFTETVMTLEGLSRFIIADITKPRSVPWSCSPTFQTIWFRSFRLFRMGKNHSLCSGTYGKNIAIGCWIL